MKKIIAGLVVLILFMNVSSAEVYHPNEVAIISDAAGKNTFPERILMYEEIADIVHSYLYPNSDSADQLQEVDIDSVSLLVYTEVPQYCVRIIICNEPLAYATIYIDANTLEVTDITPKDYRTGHLLTDP